MSYVYKYLPSSLVASAQKGLDPKEQSLTFFQRTLQEQFYNATNWFTIGEEQNAGTQVYTDVDVRVTHLINAETGLKLGDDWKHLAFPDVSHNIFQGMRFSFDNNIWVVINLEQFKTISPACGVRRCNNVLRWIDEATGIYYQEPIALEYLIKESRDSQGSPFMTPGGFIKGYLQYNNTTKKLKPNQRFLFGEPGHWTCFKIVGTGLNDMHDSHTFDNDCTKLLYMDLVTAYTNDETDDLINGIADAFTYPYTIKINQSSIQSYPGSIIQLSATVTYNNNIVNRNLVWSSSNTRIATITSGSGLLSLLTSGSCLISAQIENNDSAIATCPVTVSASPTSNSYISITPNLNYILEGATRTYSVYLYTDGVQKANIFTFSCSGSNVPSTSYVFTPINGNSFSVTNNLRNDSSYLPVICSGSILGAYEFDIYLRGAWLNGST